MAALEKHYTVKEIMAMWRWGKDRVIRAFENEPDVMRDGHEEIMAQGRRPHKRRYFTYSIRVHNRFLRKKHGVSDVMPRVEEV